MRACLSDCTGILNASRAPAALLLTLLWILPACAQPPSPHKYVISIGTSSQTIPSATLWLYSYSWYGLEKIKLAKIENGLALLPLDPEAVKRELHPHLETDGYVVALQVGEHLWYRTPEISPDVLWNDLSLAVNALGKAAPMASGETRLSLPPLTKRRITLLYRNGRPAANKLVHASVYLWNNNRCGYHEGLPLATRRTDKTGTIEVTTQLLPLYPDGITYYEDAGKGPAGVAQTWETGLKTGPEATLTFRKHWALTKDARSFDVEVLVSTPAGLPRKGVGIFAYFLTNGCLGFGDIGWTDSEGIASINIDPTLASLQLFVRDDDVAGDPQAERAPRDFTDAELRELFLKRKITIRW